METKTAVIEIMKPLAYFDEKYKYQDVPLHALDERMVYIKKGASGNKMISTKNIKLLKVFNSSDKESIKSYIEELRNKNIGESIGVKKVINENINNNGIEYVFKENPELSNIGTMEQYSKYLNTIFPNSKVKGIFYHASPNKFSEFRDPAGSGFSHIWFSEEPIIGGGYGNNIYSVILNIENPLSEYDSQDYNKEIRRYEAPINPNWVNNYGTTGELPIFKYDGTIRASRIGLGGNKSITVRNPKQIHILGSKQDIEGFKKYVGINNINEGLRMKKIISEGLRYHLNNRISINESIYRPGSEAHINLLAETRELYDNGLIELNRMDWELFETTDIGRFGTFKGQVVPLDVFLIEYDGGKYDETDDIEDEIDVDEVEEYLKEQGWGDLSYENFIDFEKSDYYTGTLNTKKYAREMNKYMKDLSIGLIEGIIEEKVKKKKHPPLGKIRRNSGSGKKYVVYVKNPSTGKIKKITFGDKKGGLRAKTGNSKARKSFAARHNCAKKKDRMTAGYWACRLNRSGLVGKTTSGYW